MSEGKEIEILSETAYLDTDEAYRECDGFLVHVFTFRVLDGRLINDWHKYHGMEPCRDEFVMWEAWQERLEIHDRKRREYDDHIRELLGWTKGGGRIVEVCGDVYAAAFAEKVGGKRESDEKTDRVD